jgi:hypothetical protein
VTAFDAHATAIEVELLRVTGWRDHQILALRKVKARHAAVDLELTTEARLRIFLAYLWCTCRIGEWKCLLTVRRER